MKFLGKALVFIFLTLCIIFGLGISKGYEKYVAKNFITEVFVRVVVFLALLRVSLFLIVPLFNSILDYLNINFSTTMFTNMHLTKYIFNPVVVLVAACGSLIFGIYSLGKD
jgi:succinate dehydrogenase hydrophobic anchor subunit